MSEFDPHPAHQISWGYDMWHIFVFLLIIVSIIIGAGYLSGSAPLYKLKPLLSKKYVNVELFDGQHEFNVDFTTIAKVVDGKVDKNYKVYRYPATQVGIVKLYDDGTASYCGDYKWRVKRSWWLIFLTKLKTVT